MKMYNNGQRKAMMYGGMSKRKPMMYGGMAKKKPRKKAYGGGMMTSAGGPMTPGRNKMQNNMAKMAKGGFPDLTGDGEGTQADILKGRKVI